MISILLIILAAICNAIMDSVETEISFFASRFHGHNPKFWCKPVSAHAVNFLPFTKYRVDAWHLAKSGMIILLLFVPLFHVPLFQALWNNQTMEQWNRAWAGAPANIGTILIYGLLWNITFNLSYKFFKRPKPKP